MKRFHVHVSVDKLDDSIRFYSSLFGAEPSVKKSDYAKWMLDDPRVNFAISHRGHAKGINHLGFQVDSDAELKTMRSHLETADTGMVEQTGAACCYAKSDKYWVTDPSGIAWETFHSLGTVPVFGEDAANESKDSGCCIPVKASVGDKDDAGCCVPATNESKKSACCG
jgi:catechol 2,3-dioxygenase-like lactoylglutathione lyase family enzyme